MRIPRTATLAILAVCTAALVLASSGAAGESDPTLPIRLTDEEMSGINSMLEEQAISCNLGYPGPATYKVAYLYPAGADDYYTLLRPGQCAACAGSDVARLTRAYVALDFRRACTINLQYAIVANVGTASCPTPNPGAELCITRFASYTATSPGAQVIALDLADSCKFQGSAFLKISFTGFGAACNNANSHLLIGTTPLLLLVDACTACASYNISAGEQEDLCAEPDPLKGNPVMWAEAWSCFVPNLRRSWGSLKIRYQ